MAWDREITFTTDDNKQIKALIYSGQFIARSPWVSDNDATPGEVVGLFIRDPDTIKLIHRKDPIILDLFCEALKIIDEFALVARLPDVEGMGYSDEELEIVAQSQFASSKTRKKAAQYLHNMQQGKTSQLTDSPMPQPGYVYLLRGKDYYKIGLTTREVAERVSEFSPRLPFEVEMIHSLRVEDVYAAETYLHQRFADKRLNGEWFELSDEDVAWIREWTGEIK